MYPRSIRAATLRSRALDVFSEVDRAQRVSICGSILFGMAGEHENLELLGALQHELVQSGKERSSIDVRSAFARSDFARAAERNSLARRTDSSISASCLRDASSFRPMVRSVTRLISAASFRSCS